MRVCVCAIVYWILLRSTVNGRENDYTCTKTECTPEHDMNHFPGGVEAIGRCEMCGCGVCSDKLSGHTHEHGAGHGFAGWSNAGRRVGREAHVIVLFHFEAVNEGVHAAGGGAHRMSSGGSVRWLLTNKL